MYKFSLFLFFFSTYYAQITSEFLDTFTNKDWEISLPEYKQKINGKYSEFKTKDGYLIKSQLIKGDLTFEISYFFDKSKNHKNTVRFLSYSGSSDETEKINGLFYSLLYKKLGKPQKETDYYFIHGYGWEVGDFGYFLSYGGFFGKYDVKLAVTKAQKKEK